MSFSSNLFKGEENKAILILFKADVGGTRASVFMMSHLRMDSLSFQIPLCSTIRQGNWFAFAQAMNFVGDKV